MPSENNQDSDPLREVEEHFSQFVSTVQDYAIFLLDPKGNIKTWNAGAERIKGYTAKDIIGKHFSIFYPQEALARDWPNEELKSAARDVRFEDESWRLRKDGSRFSANVIITALYNADGSVRGFFKITRDLTERKAAEERLRLSEERFRLLVEGVKDYAIFMLDTEGKIVSWNSGAQRLKGYRPDEIIGQHFSRFYPSEDILAGKPRIELEEAMKNGSVEDEGWRVRKDRSLFWANVVITAIYDEKKRHIGFAKVTRDMTDKRKVVALEIADRQKNEFLAMLAHELRNPLAPISNGLQVLKLPGVTDSTVQKTTEMMERQVFHLVRLVDDLLDVSRIMMGKMTYEREPVALSDVVHRAIEEAMPSIDARGHELIVSAPARSIAVHVDPLRMSQVISNLLMNAAKYTSEPDRIWISVQREGDQAVITVKDVGIGIAPEVLPKIFNLFVQADNALARAQGGLGIGLTVVKRIVEMHGGEVRATSAGLGRGSEFTVRLPALESDVPASTAPAPPRTARGPKRKILVVDDNVDAVITITTLLKAWGHEVHGVFSGTTALEAVREFKPDIILLDIGLPGMSGYEVARNLRAQPLARGIVLAALTGYGQESDRQRSFEAGFDYHLTKPPDPTVLESLLASPRLRVPAAVRNGENN